MSLFRNLIIALLVAAAGAAGASTNVFHAQWFFVNDRNEPLTNRTVNITPLWTVTDSGTNLAIGNQRYPRNTTNTGSITISNLVAGGYRVEYSGPFSLVTFTNVFPTNIFGLINAGDSLYLSAAIPVNGATVAYSQTAADARFLNAAGDDGSNLSNVVAGSVAAEDVTGAGTFSSTTTGVTITGGVGATLANASITISNLPQAQVTNLVADLAARLNKTNGTAQTPTLNNATNTGTTTFPGGSSVSAAGVYTGTGAGALSSSTAGVTISGGAGATLVNVSITITNLPQAQVTNLLADLAARLNKTNDTAQGLTLAGATTISGNATVTGTIGGTYSNHVWKFQETIGTTNTPMVGNFTNQILNTAGKHVTVTAGSPFITSSDGAFSGYRRGFQLEFLDNNQQLMIFKIVDSNNAQAYELGAGTCTIPSLNNTANTNWRTRPIVARWSDDTVGAENYGGHWDDNGMMHFAAIGDQGLIFFDNFDNASTSYIGVGRETGVGLPSTPDGHIFGISSQTTNTSLVGNFTPLNSFWVHNKAPTESVGIMPSGLLALGGGAAYNGTALEGITNRHWNQVTIWNPLNIANSATPPPIIPTGGGGLWVSNKVIYYSTSTKTNLISDGR
jgi:hypothetical protein